MKALIFIVSILFSVSSFADNCSKSDKRKIVGGAIAVGVVAGAAIGFTIAAVIPVGAVGGPMSIAAIPGTPTMGAWIVKTVIPITVIPAVSSGAILGLIAKSGIDEACAIAVANKLKIKM